MNAAFRTMSDLLADAEDLLARIRRSDIPQVRALMEPVRLCVGQMKELLRERARKLRPLKSAVSDGPKTRWLQAAAAALLTLGALAWWSNRIKPKRSQRAS
jgi:hypothetical protein